MQGYLSYRKALRLSVCLSVRTPSKAWIVTKFCPRSYTIWRIEPPSLLTRSMFRERRSLLSQILGKIDPPLQKRQLLVDIRL